MKLIAATNNKKKLKEISEIMSGYGFEVVSQAEMGINTETEETGDTFEENAVLKAEAVFNITKLPSIADDSGLSVDALGGAPGVFSARYAGIDGKNCDDISNYMLLLKNMGNIPIQNRTARFVCAICYINEKGERLIFRGECEGYIGFSPSGESGFGYDPVFFVGDKSFAEIDSEKKNKISHRGKALNMLSEYLSNVPEYSKQIKQKEE